jgi:hypothetical protein
MCQPGALSSRRRRRCSLFCFDFLPAKDLLRKARDLSRAAAKLDEQTVAASQNERNWEPAKAFIMAAEKAGVDTCDQQALTSLSSLLSVVGIVVMKV